MPSHAALPNWIQEELDAQKERYAKLKAEQGRILSHSFFPILLPIFHPFSPFSTLFPLFLPRKDPCSFLPPLSTPFANFAKRCRRGTTNTRRPQSQRITKQRLPQSLPHPPCLTPSSPLYSSIHPSNCTQVKKREKNKFLNWIGGI